MTSTAGVEFCMSYSKIVGLYLTPLPGESSFSALMRLGWLNSFKRRDLAEYCLGNRNSVPFNHDFNSPTWIRSEHLSRRLGWKLPDNNEIDIEKKFSKNRIPYWCSRLKFCPLCMEGMYHSYWFQLPDLRLCPFHNCELMERCMYCSAKSPNYSFDLVAYNNPYFCVTCGKPYSGAEPDLETHFELRDQSRFLEDSFSRYVNWLGEFSAEKYLKCFPESKLGAELSEWCDLGSIRSNYINKISALPTEATHLVRHDIIELKWRVLMNDHDSTGHEGLNYYNWCDMRKVLSLFSRYIEPWAFMEGEGESKLSWARFYDSKPLYLGEFDAKQLAFMIVFHAHSWRSGPCKSQLGNMQGWNNRVPKIAYLAYLYGVFCGIYHSIKKQQLKNFSRPFQWLPVHNYSIVICDVSEVGVHSGRVIFPKVPGMPIAFRFGRS